MNYKSVRFILLAVRTDEKLAKLFAIATIPQGGVVPHINPVLLPKKSKKGTEELESSFKATKSPKILRFKFFFFFG